MVFPAFFRAQNSAKHPENTLRSHRTADRWCGIVRRSADFSKKHDFWNWKTRNLGQCNSLEIRIKTRCETPKIRKKRKSFVNSGLRVARGKLRG